MTKPLMIELFAGSATMAKEFQMLGYDTFTVDWNQNSKGSIDLVTDIHSLTPADLPTEPSVIWASPPCTYFSLARAQYKAFAPGGKPLTPEAVESVELVRHTLGIIEHMKPTYWFLENPRAHLRQQPMMRNLTADRVTVMYCQYGEPMQKPTDIWGRFPITWKPRQRCNHMKHQAQIGGTHDIVPKAETAILPLELCEEIARACVDSKGAYKHQMTLEEWL